MAKKKRTLTKAEGDKVPAKKRAPKKPPPPVVDRSPPVKPEQLDTSGKPVDFTPELGDLICGLISEGHSLRRICELDGMPHISTIFSWRRRYKDFDEQYARAREDRADALAEDIQEIADEDPKLVEIILPNGDPTGELRVDAAYENWRKTRIDSRKWLASKFGPRKYGEKVTQEHTGPEGKPLMDPNAPAVIILSLDQAKEPA